MSSRKASGQSNKGKNKIGSSSLDIDELNQAVKNVNLYSNHVGSWEAFSQKNKKRSGNVKHSDSHTPKQNSRRQSDARRSGERRNVQMRPLNNARATAQAGGMHYGNHHNPALNAIPPPLQNGWNRNWNSRNHNPALNAIPPQAADVAEDVDVEDHDDDELYGSDDEFNYDDYDSDEALKTHEERKKNRWYADFFETLDSLTVDQIKEPTRQWHCPACQNGPGAIDWYCSLQALVTHAKTKGAKRVKIHRDLAEILEEELRIKGASINPAGKSYGQWMGLNEVVKDKEIVWPPIVIIMNTRLEQNENEKWVGMGNPELLDYFGSYEAEKARHSYGPNGHMGMSALIFEASGVGYTEAVRLCEHFEDECTDRVAWERNPILFHPGSGGKRKLYGYMATKRDMDIFNKHSHGKSKLKFELVSYQEKVVDQLKQMNEEHQQLHWFKKKAVTHQRRAKELEENVDFFSEKLRKKETEDCIMRERTRQHCEQKEEEMDSQEQFFKQQIKLMQDARIAKEGQFDKVQEDERVRVEGSFSSLDPQREEKLEEIKEYKEEREKLKSLYMKKKMELEKWFDTELTRLMDTYTQTVSN